MDNNERKILKKIDHNIYEIDGKRGKSFKVRVPYYDIANKRREFNRNFLVSKYANKSDALKAAKEWRDERAVESHQKIIVKTKKKYTLDEVFEKTLEYRGKTIETNRKWRLWYGKFITSIIPGDTKFSEIDWDVISKTLNAMVDNSTQDMINRIITIWKKMCAYANYHEIISKNPMMILEIDDDILESNKVVKKRNKTLSIDDFKKLLNDFPYRKNDVKEAFLEMVVLIIMAYAGMRPAEVFVLCKQDFNLANRSIRIYRRLGSTKKERNVETSLKKKGFDREVYYSSEIDELIDILFRVSDGDKLFYINGRYLNSNILSDDVRRISNGKIRSYMLRHAFSNDLMINKNMRGGGIVG